MLFCHSRGRHCLHRPSFVRLIIRCRLRESRWTTIFFSIFFWRPGYLDQLIHTFNFFPFRFDQRQVIHIETRKFIWNNSSAVWASQWSNPRQLCDKQTHQPTKLTTLLNHKFGPGCILYSQSDFGGLIGVVKEKKKKSDLKNYSKKNFYT